MGDPKNNKRVWSDVEKEILVSLRDRANMDFLEISAIMGRNQITCQKRYNEYRASVYKSAKFLTPSRMPSCGTPMTITGNALVLTDTEFPYQHVDFINHCVDLAHSVGVKTCIVGGDFVHFGNLSSFSRAFAPTRSKSIPEELEPLLDAMSEYVTHLKSNSEREVALEIIEKIEAIEYAKEDIGNVSVELDMARRGIKELVECFDKTHVIVGNHDDRLARQFYQGAIEVQEYVKLLEIPENCEVSPFYYCCLNSSGQFYQIEHPTNSTKYSARRLAGKFARHILAGHSHQYSDSFDPSGKYWAIEIGCCSDETKMPYATMRHNAQDAHKLGAVLVLDGYPYHLNESTQWDRMKKLI